jgi:ribonuclease HI
LASCCRAAGLVEGKQTNNTGEGFAIFHALTWASSNGYKTIKICSDSQISLNNLKKPAFMVKENRELFEKIENLIKEKNLIVVYEKVPGHSDNINNNRADKLANGLVGIKS